MSLQTRSIPLSTCKVAAWSEHQLYFINIDANSGIKLYNDQLGRQLLAQYDWTDVESVLTSYQTTTFRIQLQGNPNLVSVEFMSVGSYLGAHKQMRRSGVYFENY